MLLCVANAVTTELIRLLLVKPTVSFYIKQTQGKFM